MTRRVVSCTKCRTVLASPEFYRSEELTGCPGCGSLLHVDLFPAFFRDFSPGAQPENVVAEGESSCFYHAQKRAVVPCALCGRFLCALCDVELNGEHFCPGCLEKGQEKHTLQNLENRRVRYDRLALGIALVPLLVWPLTLLGGPAAVYFALRHWNSPLGIVSSGRIRLVLALVLGILEIVAWAFGLYFVFNR